jgi:hypothetical protein
MNTVAAFFYSGIAAGLVACSGTIPQASVCADDGGTYSALLDGGDGGATLPIGTTTTTTTITTLDGSLVDGGVVGVATIQNPATALVPLMIVANFSCPVQGPVRVLLVASAGQFGSGAPASGGGTGGSASNPPSVGPTGSSTTILLNSTSNSETILTGSTVLQLTTGRAATVQLSMGDATSCSIVTVDNLINSAATFSVVPCAD